MVLLMCIKFSGEQEVPQNIATILTEPTILEKLLINTLTTSAGC
jgi:hypothetical protein